MSIVPGGFPIPIQAQNYEMLATTHNLQPATLGE